MSDKDKAATVGERDAFLDAAIDDNFGILRVMDAERAEHHNLEVGDYLDLAARTAWCYFQAGAAHQRQQAREVVMPDVVEFAVSRWEAEVKHRPLVNVHRRALDGTWRQIIRFAGGDPDHLCGPDHDTLMEVGSRAVTKQGKGVME